MLCENIRPARFPAQAYTRPVPALPSVRAPARDRSGERRARLEAMRQARQDQAEQEPDLETTYGAEAAALIRDIISLSTVHGPLKIVFKDLGSDNSQ